MDTMKMKDFNDYLNWYGWSRHEVLKRAGQMNVSYTEQLLCFWNWLLPRCALETPSVLDRPLRKVDRLMRLDRDSMQCVLRRDGGIHAYMSQTRIGHGTAVIVVKLSALQGNKHIDIGAMRHSYDQNVGSFSEVMNRFSFSSCRQGKQVCISGISKFSLVLLQSSSERTDQSMWALTGSVTGGDNKRGPPQVEKQVKDYQTFFEGGDTVAVVLNMNSGTMSVYKNGTNCGVIDSGLWGSYRFVVSMYPRHGDATFGDATVGDAMLCGAKADEYMLEHCGTEWVEGK
jgi:hypothetical protein